MGLRIWTTAAAVFALVITLLASEARSDEAPVTVEQALASFDLPDDLQLEAELTEPQIAQPLHISFDERGRLWLVEFRQYPHPAGLKIVSHDNFYRNIYDKVPPAPPNHFVGKDKITIHEDTDGDGAYDLHKTFVEGLSLVTSVARGRGGVWVLNPPYLLFYPDRNNDDVPDGDPEVHLSGFGIEDSHSVTNSLRFGPDGWLYAAQGSTVTANVRRVGIDPPDKPEVQSAGQLIWRYHPETRRFEIFAEGGGNAFGCEIDRDGRIFSGHNGGDTRGFYYLQGAYLQKGFNKHGPLSNPYSFGYFPAMKHGSVPRFTHEFTLYDGGSLPERYNGKLFGVAPLLNYVNISEIAPDGSTFKTSDLCYLQSKNKWFRPVDITIGPDGALYIADWFDAQCSHLRNHVGEIDLQGGRIYRLKARGAQPATPRDLGAMSSGELVNALADKNIWVRQTALRLLGDRRDPAVRRQLRALLLGTDEAIGREALWALHQSGGIDEATSLQALEHSNPAVRSWAARLLGDDNQVSSPLAAKLADRAGRETNVETRAQLACTARRLPAADALPIIRNLMLHDEDAADAQLPLLLWWGIEAHCEQHAEAVVQLFAEEQFAASAIVRNHLLSRVMQRFATSGKRRDLLTAAKLFEQASPEAAPLLMQGFEAAYRGRTPGALPDELVAAMAKSGAASLPLRARLREPAAIAEATAKIADGSANPALRQECVAVLGELRIESAVEPLLAIVEEERDAGVRRAALAALDNFADPKIAATLLANYGKLPAELTGVALNLLASRVVSSLALLAAIDQGQLPQRDVPLPIVRKMLLHKQADIQQLVNKLWGADLAEQSAQLRIERERLSIALTSGTGSPYEGKKLFRQQCAKCHTLFSDGGQVGPDLTPYKRDDVDNILRHIIEPSAEIREGFETFAVQTDDGRSFAGFLADQDEKIVVLRGYNGETTTIPRDEIEAMRATGQSLMPEGLLAALSEQQVRDLFSYLRSTQPLAD